MARQRLGQHFLRDNSVARRIVSAADLGNEHVVVEVGPGNGALTDLLVKESTLHGGSVVLVEIDQQLANRMRRRFKHHENVRIIEADARNVDFDEIPELRSMPAYKVVANLPYYAGTPIVRSFLEREVQPSKMVVMLQREVAEEMCANPGKMSLLSLAVQIHATPKKLFNVAPSAFAPPPKVHSTVVELVPLGKPLVGSSDVGDFFKIAKSAFLGRRKQLHNSLSHGLGMTVEAVKAMALHANIDTERRPSTLSLEEWVALLKEWQNISREVEVR